MLGKKPTIKQQKRFDQIHERGCVPCWLEATLQGRKWVPEPCDIHHVNQDSHDDTYGNCPWHHRGVPKFGFNEAVMRTEFGPSMAKQPQSYRARYGSEDDLLVYQAKLLLKSPNQENDQ